MKELLRDFLEQMNNAITEEDAATTLLNYLMVSSQNLKTENGKIGFLPSNWKKKNKGYKV